LPKTAKKGNFFEIAKLKKIVITSNFFIFYIIQSASISAKSYIFGKKASALAK